MPIGAPADRLRRVLSAAALCGFFAFFGSSPAMAADLRGGDRIEVSGPVDDDVYAAGQEVGVSGAVVGDVIAAGMTVTLPGSVGGSFNAAARTVELSGEVAGSVRAAGQTVDLQGAIGGDAIAGARTVKLGVQGVVGRDLIVAAQEVEVDGRVTRRLVGTTGEVRIRGNVAGVEIRADQVILAQGARVDGDLVYTSATKADIQEGAVVTGRVVQRRPPSEPASRGAAVQVLISAVGAALLGLGALWLAPPFLPAASRVLRKSQGSALGWGLAGLFLIPVALVLLLVAAAFTGVGGLLVFALTIGYAALLVFAKVVVGFTLGSLVLRRPEVEPQVDFGKAFMALVVGVVILSILSAIPVIGGLILAVVGLVGFGAALSAYLWWRRNARSASITGVQF